MIQTNTSFTLQASLACTNAYGEATRIWQTGTTVMFLPMMLSENESIEYQKQGFKEVVKLYTPDVALSIKEGDKVTYSSREYYVLSVYNPQNRNHHLEIIAGMKNG